MLKFRATLFIAVLLILVRPQQAAAQDLDCSETDFHCLQRYLEMACREETATLATCEALLGRLEKHPFAAHIDWRVTIATAWWMLADFATIPALAEAGSLTEDEATNFRRQSKILFEDILVDDADNTEVLLALAQFSNDETARLEYLRKAYQADPGNYIIVNGFVQALLADSANAESRNAAAQALEAAFFLNDVMEQRWRLAAHALELYEQGGDRAAYTDFRETLAGIAQRDASSSTIGELTEGAALESLASIRCQHAVIGIFGTDICLSLVSTLMQLAISEQEPARRLQFAEAAATAMTQAEGNLTITRHPDYTAQFIANFDTLLSEGIESAQVHAGHATFLTDEPRIAALQKAMALDPENGHYRFGLGQAYFWRNRWHEANQHFQDARALLPDNWHYLLDRFVEQAEQRLASETSPSDR